MQEFQPIPGLAGRLFGGAAESAGLLRRGGAAAVPEEVRCPRCDSANTKFCYYNNYNLSQPRHFCKGCRRYWTKGGLLRNVPVGGGCRKPKRKAASSDVDKDVSGANSEAKNVRSGCSAGNSSLTSAASSASTNTVDDVGAIAAAHAAAHSSGGRMLATGLGPRTFMEDAPPLQPPTPMFADQAAAFASLFGTPLPAFTFSAQRKAEDDVAPAVTHTLTEQPSSASSTADMASFSVRSTGAATASASDWPPATVIDAGIFDLAGAIGSDTTSYWNTASWTDQDGTVYLP